MTCVSPEGRISPGCTGMWNAEHVAAWKRIVDFVHFQSKAKICLQLGHSGAKGSTKLGWEGNDVPLEVGNWPVMAASNVPWSPINQVPRPMTRADMDAVRDQFVAAVRMGLECGFDMVELHAAHGYLLASFISPLQNTRTDEYGGSLGNRLRYPLEVFAAMRAAWPSDKPMSVRISATDWAGEDGITPDEAVLIGETASATRASSRPWRSATSMSPITPIRSSPLGAPTWSRWRGRTSSIRCGRCARRRSSTIATSLVRRSTSTASPSSPAT
jgi:anthraniloyl-CoA monooxygenase